MFSLVGQPTVSSFASTQVLLWSGHSPSTAIYSREYASRLIAVPEAADQQNKGGLWLANTTGMQMHPVPNRLDLALNISADGLLQGCSQQR
jgi:hypothetical protein